MMHEMENFALSPIVSSARRQELNSSLEWLSSEVK